MEFEKEKMIADLVAARLLRARKFLWWWIMPAKDYDGLRDMVMGINITFEKRNAAQQKRALDASPRAEKSDEL